MKLSIIHYLALSLATCHIPPIHTEKVDFQPQFCWLWRDFERLTFNVERRGMENNTAECLRGRRRFCIFVRENAFIMMDDKGMLSGQDIPPPPQTDQVCGKFAFIPIIRNSEWKISAVLDKVVLCKFCKW